ncbi:MAG: substrate-binding domain-containing protein, partial [Ruminococcus sp.]|nr:substrate-binding domain-containing protein [Ruminococcus sp.]
MYHKYQNTEARERGEANIFSLMNPDLFDGAVLLGDTIQTAGAADKLEKRLKKSFKKPVLVIEKESPCFPSILTDCHDAIVELVSHLIDVHGCKDIAFLSGKRWHKHAQERLRAVRDAMEQHGLTLPEGRVIYGDFWYQSGELCADALLTCGKPLPDAVVCANDAMAIGLCKGLTERGVRIPEDIAVESYDSSFEGQTAPKSITSSQ